MTRVAPTMMISSQMTLGHRFIKSEFNQTLNIGWHIDPFGHLAPQARLFSEMGFDAWLFERIDDEEFEERKENGELEMVWRPESYNREKNYLLAHVNFMKHYKAPFSYCITVICDPDSEFMHDLPSRYAEWMKNQLSYYPSKRHILHQVGGDFEWYWSEKNYIN